MTENNETPFIRITNREIYDGITDLTRRVASLENRVDVVLRENVSIKNEYGGRIRSLELRFYGVLAGLIAALTALGVGMGVGG
jgi:hypothetical protein